MKGVVLSSKAKTFNTFSASRVYFFYLPCGSIKHLNFDEIFRNQVGCLWHVEKIWFLDSTVQDVVGRPNFLKCDSLMTLCCRWLLGTW